MDMQNRSLHPIVMQPNLFLEGNFAPLSAELTLNAKSDFDIRGKIPRDLHGSIYRNGPNPAQHAAANHHWFLGDGMVHAFHFNRGEVSYRNAWLRTPTFEIEKRLGRSVFLDGNIHPLANLQLIGGNIIGLVTGLLRRGNADIYTKLISKANTSVLAFRDQLYALVESSPVLRLQPFTLETTGFEEFGEGFVAPFTAHPKIDPATGYLYGFGYRVVGQPKLEYYVINPSGRLVSRTAIQIPYSAMIHDFVITRNYAVIPVFPAVASLAALRRGRIAEWQPDKPSRVYVIARSGEKTTLRSFDMPSGYIYHYANAFEEGGAIFVDGIRYDKVPLMGSDAEMRAELFDGANPGSFNRFRIDLKTGSVDEVMLYQGGFFEFPVIDSRLTGAKYETAFAALRTSAARSAEGIFDGQLTLQISKGRTRAEVTHFAAGHFGGEPVFVPTGPTGSNKGYLLNIIYDSKNEHSYLGIFDATKPDKKPVCEIHVPHRIPYGFHGTWRTGRA